MQSASMDVSSTPSPIQPTLQTHASSGSQIRSRVTVVCAECKRLKLKCDRCDTHRLVIRSTEWGLCRRTPCSSCLKRDTVQRCTYSAAAAEKVDVQSLHNRVLVLETQISQLTSGKVKLPSHELDRTLLAVGYSGSSVLVPPDDTASIWLEHLDLGRQSGVDLQPACVAGSWEPEPADKRGDFLRLTSSPRSIGDTSSPHPSSTASHFSSSLNVASLTTVTPSLLSLLPPAHQRPALLDQLGAVLRMHPSLNFPQFRARVNAMFLDSNSPEEIGIGPQRTTHTDKPTLSFFAAAAAGFALALQCSATASGSSPQISHSSASSPAPSSSQASVTSLLSLSARILGVAEDTVAYDLDYLHALILRCLCLLHDGQPRVHQVIFATVGKMVNIARLMGLSCDPDELTLGLAGKYSLWEAEMRRRMWWDIFYYDLFISDCMGLPPLISDDGHTCRLPLDVDEDAFVPKSITLPPPPSHLGASNFSYFIQKCKLAQLVKNLKKRVNVEATNACSSGNSPCQEPSIEVATKAEADIQQFLYELPPPFKLDLDSTPFEPISTSSSPNVSTPPMGDSAPPHLIIQRCELIAISHQLILKLFHPFLRRRGVRISDTSMIASINACHAIINAARLARSVWQRGTGGGQNHIPSSHGIFYPFGRQLFDAAVVAAHVVIQAPQSVVAKVALEDTRTALEILRDPAMVTGRGRPAARGGVEGAPHEAVAIVEMLLKKAEMAKRNFVLPLAGTKRKLDEIDPTISKGFWLPYVSSGVATGSGAGGSTMGILSGSTLNPHGSPRTRFVDKSFTDGLTQHARTPSGSTVTSATPANRAIDKDRKYPQNIRTRISTSALTADNKSPGSSSLRRESSFSTLSTGSHKQQQTPTVSPADTTSNPDVFSRPGTSVLEESSAMVRNPSSIIVNDYPMSSSYTIEDNTMPGVNLSPTSGFPPPQSHAQPPYHPTNPSTQQHHTTYNISPYSAEQSSLEQPYYVPYASSTPSRPEYPSMPGHPPTHLQDSNPQQAHSHLDVLNLMPQQHQLHNSDVSQIPKQEEDVRQNEQAHIADTSTTPFASEPWNNTRFTQPQWGPGYSY